MKREKLFYIGAMAVLAVVLVLTMWYKRPLNIWEVTGVAEPGRDLHQRHLRGWDRRHGAAGADPFRRR